MKSIKIGSIILFLSVILVTVFIGGKQINSTIEETIKSNYQTEINALKEKLNKQTELINSIININNKNEENSSTNNTNISDTNSNVTNNTNSNEELVEFEYIIENGGITITKYIGKNI